MNKYIKIVYTSLVTLALTFSLAGCGNDEDEADKGKEKNSVHKPKDDYEKTGNINRLEKEK